MAAAVHESLLCHHLLDSRRRGTRIVLRAGESIGKSVRPGNAGQWALEEAEMLQRC
jgi:hypothetical protein